MPSDVVCVSRVHAVCDGNRTVEAKKGTGNDRECRCRCRRVCVCRYTITALGLLRLDSVGVFGLLQCRSLAGRKGRLLGFSALLANMLLGSLRLVGGLALPGRVSQDSRKRGKTKSIVGHTSLLWFRVCLSDAGTTKPPTADPRSRRLRRSKLVTDWEVVTAASSLQSSMWRHENHFCRLESEMQQADVRHAPGENQMGWEIPLQQVPEVQYYLAPQNFQGAARRFRLCKPTLIRRETFFAHHDRHVSDVRDHMLHTSHFPIRRNSGTNTRWIDVAARARFNLCSS